MPRRKIAMRLIENARARGVTYAKRTKGLQKKAAELATLCAVSVALVCVPADGAGARLVWESEEGVLDRYRAAAIPPDARARHAHRGYLESELGKERAKLARARPGALPDWDAALNDVTLDEAREVLAAIDAALRAAGDRMTALGLPTDGPLEIEQVVASDGDASGVVPRHLGLEVDMDMGAGFQLQMVPCHGDGGGLLEQFLMQPGYGVECVGGGGSYDVGAADETQAPGGYGANADCGWPDLTMCCAADQPWAPVGYYPDFTDGVAAPGHYSAQDVTGGDYVDTLPLEYPMGMGMDENLNYLDMDNSYAAHWQAEEFQRADAGTGQYQCLDPGTCSSNQSFQCLY